MEYRHTRYVDSEKNEKFEKEIGKVTPEFEQLAEKYGENIKGYVHSVDSFFVKHDRNAHGNVAREKEYC